MLKRAEVAITVRFHDALTKRDAFLKCAEMLMHSTRPRLEAATEDGGGNIVFRFFFRDGWSSARLFNSEFDPDN